MRPCPRERVPAAGNAPAAAAACFRRSVLLIQIEIRRCQFRSTSPPAAGGSATANRHLAAIPTCQRRPTPLPCPRPRPWRPLPAAGSPPNGDCELPRPQGALATRCRPPLPSYSACAPRLRPIPLPGARRVLARGWRPNVGDRPATRRALAPWPGRAASASRPPCARPSPARRRLHCWHSRRLEAPCGGRMWAWGASARRQRPPGGRPTLCGPSLHAGGSAGRNQR